MQLQREYVAGGSWSDYGAGAARTLPLPIDDVTRDFGDDLYDRMLYDPQVAATVTIFKASILETGPKITSPITDDAHPEYDRARELAEQAERMLADLEDSFDDVLWDLWNCVALGNRVAEQTYRFASSLKGERILYLDKLKVKPRETTLFAVDQYKNIVGLLVKLSNSSDPQPGLVIYTRGNQRYKLLSRDKFIITTFRPKDADPRGTSIIRPAYSPWWRKQQIIPEYLKYLAQFAGPSLVGTVGPEAQPVVDAETGAVTTPEQIMLAALQAFRNGTAAAFPFGATVKEIAMQGEGAAFLRGIAQADQQITKAVLTQELATEEGKHMARAAAEVHQDVLDTLVRQGKLAASSVLRRHLFRRWVVWNWGEEQAHLAPIADFGATEARDEPALWQGIAALSNSGYLAQDQLKSIDAKIGLPIRSADDALMFQEKAAPAGQESEPGEEETEDEDDGRVPVRGYRRRPRTPTTPEKEEPAE